MSKLEEILGITFPHGVKISHATNSSKEAKNGSIFFGLPGTKEHGSNYIHEALKKGASIAIHNNVSFQDKSKNIFYVKDLQDAVEGSKSKIYFFLKELYQMPVDFMPKFYGFTGTNGKSSSAFLCHQLFRRKKSNSLYIGTLGFQYNDREFNCSLSSKTTPDIFELFQILSLCNFNIENISIEISSHALDQDRLKDIRLFYAAILNIEEDHLDYHKDIDTYANAKFKILNMTDGKIAIDDQIIEKYKGLLSYDKNSSRLVTIGQDNALSDVSFNIINSSLKKTEFTITSDDTLEYSSSIFPEFNINNLIFAIYPFLKGTLFTSKKINDLSYLILPKGRAEVISNINANIIIDYAHNPKAIKYFLTSVNYYFDNLVVVLGCGGDRDKSKRSAMLKAAIENSYKVIFTSDNSRNESFQNIFFDACKGNNLEKVLDIEDREKAIIYGTRLISHNDCLVILGKGHEKTQETNGKYTKFSDHEVVNEIYK